MDRRPNIWNYQAWREKLWRDKRSVDITNEFSKFDIEAFETLPFKERRVRQQSRNHFYKSPFDRFFMTHLGCDYNEVFSELVKRVPHKYSFALNLANFRMPLSFHPDETRWYVRKYYKRLTEGFYVDLATGVLCYEEPVSFRQKQKAEQQKPVYQPLNVTQFKFKIDYGQKFVVHQLLTYEDFHVEATKMKHCIRQYWNKCTDQRLQISIWSLSNGSGKILTIELKAGVIVQVKGLLNRKATAHEKAAIEYWANWIKVGIGEFVF